MATVNLSTLIQEVADELSPAIQERRQHLRVQLPDSLEAVVDAKLMRMMIENLLSNASKYTPEGGRIRLQAELSADVGQCCLKISDTGVGIARQDMPKLFQRFTRIPNRLSTSRGGSGLGLYLVQTITELHEGRLRVDSRPGHGTTFEVVLPVGAGQRSSSQRKARLA
jgi:two-component system phosphate regulon sensor histidine kinase PhoR